MKFVICGNGFDLHHGLATSYSDYKKFLQNNHCEVINRYEKLVKINDDTVNAWSDIEKALGIDCFKLFVKLSVQLNIRDEIDQLTHDEIVMTSSNTTLLKDLTVLTSFINDFTGSYLYDWISSIDCRNAIPDLSLDNNDKYVNFIYTNTLESIYHINSANILHIHGKLSDLNNLDEDVKEYREFFEDEFLSQEEFEYACRYYKNSIIRQSLEFGSVISDIRKINEDLHMWYRGDEDYYRYVSPALSVLDNYVMFSTKSPNENFECLKRFIDPVNEIDTVVIMGHSLNSIDNAYYSHVLVPVLIEKHWLFMVHGDDERTINSFVKKMGIRNYHIEHW